MNTLKIEMFNFLCGVISSFEILKSASKALVNKTLYIFV